MEKTGIESGLLEVIEKRKLSHFGHILRKEGSCLEGEIIQGTTSGSRHQGRPRARREDDIIELTGLKGDLLLQSAEDRSRWRSQPSDRGRFKDKTGHRAFKVSGLKSERPDCLVFHLCAQ